MLMTPWVWRCLSRFWIKWNLSPQRRQECFFSTVLNNSILSLFIQNSKTVSLTLESEYVFLQPEISQYEDPGSVLTEPKIMLNISSFLSPQTWWCFRKTWAFSCFWSGKLALHWVHLTFFDPEGEIGGIFQCNLSTIPWVRTCFFRL